MGTAGSSFGFGAFAAALKVDSYLSIDDVFVGVLGMILASEWLRFGCFFRIFSVNVDFVKISVSSRREHDFGPLERPETHQKAMQTRIQTKTLKIIIPTSIFDCTLAFQKPSKIIHFSNHCISKSLKFTKNCSRGLNSGFWDASWTRLFLKVGFGRVLGRICENF